MTNLTLTCLPHPAPDAAQAGFQLRSEYVERCYLPVLGPTSLAFLRRVPDLWRQQCPAVVSVPDLAHQLGLGRGSGRNHPLPRTLERLVQFRVAEWLEPQAELGLYGTLPPLSDRQLARVPTEVHQAHQRLLDAHLQALAATHGR